MINGIYNILNNREREREGGRGEGGSERDLKDKQQKAQHLVSLKSQKTRRE